MTSSNIHGVVQNASAKSGSRPKRRGRPPKFDPDEVVSAAIGAFFEKGFAETTLGDLEAATGIDRSTLYNSFGGKSGLYNSATTEYLSLAKEHLFAPLYEGTDDGLGDIVEFLDVLHAGLLAPDASPGCLIVNDMAAGVNAEASERYRGLLEGGLRVAMERSGAFDADEIDRRVRLIASSVIGINLVSKATTDRAEVERLVDALTDEVRTWRSG